MHRSCDLKRSSADRLLGSTHYPVPNTLYPTLMQQKILLYCSKLLGRQFGKVSPLQGGDINDVYLLQTDQEAFVVKINSNSRFPEMLLKEALGLELLRSTHSIRIPEVMAVELVDDEALLIMEYIQPSTKTPDFWENFGRQLAHLHQHRQDYYGLLKDNYIGSLWQDNQPSPSWPAFYITQRLYPQMELAEEKGLLDKETKKAFQQLFMRLPDILPEEPPSLIHGDLWTGNFLADGNENAVLIDPAVCYASREMDLAMSKLFGGFSERFYAAYEEVYPTEPGLEERIGIYQLYYLMVHVNLFGSSYLGALRRILGPYG